MKRLIFCIILCLLSKIESNEQSKFLIDYFVFKHVPHVISFGCYNIKGRYHTGRTRRYSKHAIRLTEKLILSKEFNSLGIRTSFPYLERDSQIFHLIGSRYWKIGIFIDFSCFDEVKRHSLLSKAADWRLYGEMHSWLIFADRNFSKVVDQLDESGFGMSTDLVIAVPNIDGYQLFDVYNPWKEGGAKINITRLGVWIKKASLNVTLNQIKFRRRCNLHGLTMKASFFASKYRPKNMPLEEYLQDYSTRTQDAYPKFGYNLLLHLSETYNFTFQFGEVAEWLPDDFLGPLSRALVQNEIQFSGDAVVITHERIQLTKFVYPLWPFRTCFIFRNPQRTGIKIGEVLNPFTDKSWYATLILLITVFVILAFSLKHENSYEMSMNRWSISFLTIIGCMCQMSTEFNLERISTRMVFFHLMIFSYISYNYYNAAIISAQLNEPIFKINDSLNELGKLRLKMSSEPMMYFDLIFNIVTAWERKVFFEDKWLKIPESERFMKPEKGISLVRKGGFAYHTHPDVSYPIIDRTFDIREICELMEVNPLVPAFSGICVGYNSTFFELAKIGLSRMTEVGIRYRQLQRWTSKKPFCSVGELSVSSTDIYEFAPHLILLAIGMIMAGVILWLEFLLADLYNNQDRYKDRYYGSRASNFHVTHSFLVMLCNGNK